MRCNTMPANRTAMAINATSTTGPYIILVLVPNKQSRAMVRTGLTGLKANIFNGPLKSVAAYTTGVAYIATWRNVGKANCTSLYNNANGNTTSPKHMPSKIKTNKAGKNNKVEAVRCTLKTVSYTHLRAHE